MRIKTILFDLGNVVLPFDHNITARRIQKICNNQISQSEINKVVFKNGLAMSYERGELSSVQFFRKIKNLFNLKISYETFKPLWQDIFKSNPPINSVLGSLKKQKHRLCLLSNTNSLHFEYARNKFNILDVFDRYYLSYKMKLVKPEKDIYHQVLKSEKIEPGECLYIDDVEEYIRVARAMGIIGIQYKTFRQFKSEFEGLIDNPSAIML